MEKPFVSIVIPSFNSAHTLGQAIEACLSQDYPKDRLEIIIVDDGSSDNIGEIVKGFGIKCIRQERSGPASARNLGWRNSKGDVVCFTDADCIPENNWVSKLIEHCNMDNTGAVAGSYSIHSSPYLLDKFVHYEIQERHSRMPDYINSFGTYNVMIKRQVLEATGGFNPEYHEASGEDTDMSYRIIKSGYKIYFARDALVNHKNILKLWRYFLVQFRHGYWRMKLYREDRPMIIKDEYAYWKDFVEIFVATALAVSIFFNLNMALELAIALLIIQLWGDLKIVKRGKNLLYIFFLFITFIRVFVRILGGIFGFVRFWIFRLG